MPIMMRTLCDFLLLSYDRQEYSDIQEYSDRQEYSERPEYLDRRNAASQRKTLSCLPVRW